MYTRNVFGKFQNELALVSHFTKVKLKKKGSYCQYQISNCFDAQDTFMVDVNLDSNDTRSGCKLFEFMGILCRHILVIYQAKNVIQILNQYILHRWTKEANRYVEVDDMDTQSHESGTLRSMHACAAKVQ